MTRYGKISSGWDWSNEIAISNQGVYGIADSNELVSYASLSNFRSAIVEQRHGTSSAGIKRSNELFVNSLEGVKLTADGNLKSSVNNANSPALIGAMSMMALAFGVRRKRKR